MKKLIFFLTLSLWAQLPDSVVVGGGGSGTVPSVTNILAGDGSGGFTDTGVSYTNPIFGTTSKVGIQDGTTYSVVWTTTNHPLYFGANGITAFSLNAARTLLDVSGVTNTYLNNLKLSGKIYPSADSSTAVQINKADNSTNVVTIDTTNVRVGIGTSGPPATALDVWQNGGAVVRLNNSGTTSYSMLRFSNGGTSAAEIFVNGSAQTGYGGAGSLNLYSYNSTPISFYVNNSSSAVLTVGSSTGVGSGNASPTGTFHVYDATATTGSTKLTVKAGAGQSTTNLQEWLNNAGTILASISSGGAFVSSGAISSGGDVKIPSGSSLVFTPGLSRLSTTVDGNLVIAASAGNAFSLLQFGGTTSSFPAIKRSSATLQVRLADDSAYAIIDGQHRIQSQSVPASAAASGTAGDIAWDSSFVYICTATNTWKRAAIATW